jgi:vacuolar-type H+-ATPase subunit E/Vma4
MSSENCFTAARDGSVAVDYSLETLLANKLLKHLLYSETV